MRILRARLAGLLARRHALRAAAPCAPTGAEPVVWVDRAQDALGGAAREARIAAAHARAWATRLAERARADEARTAILAALLATERVAALHAAREPLAAASDGPARGRSGAGRPPLLH